MRHNYDEDVVAWAQEQAQLLRSGKWLQLDVEHLAKEIEDAGKSEKRALAHRLGVLVEHLYNWQKQPEQQGTSWLTTIRVQRLQVLALLDKAPSLKYLAGQPEFWLGVWHDAVLLVRETELDDIPAECPWTLEQVLAPDWLP